MNHHVRAHTLGIATIPVLNKTGRPVIDSWKSFSNELPNETLAESWDIAYPVGEEYGIAVVCGPASGLCFIDDDTGESATKRICPQSPYAKSGRPGYETRFFKYTDKLKGFGEGEGGKRVAFWTEGHYTIIPPSIRRQSSDGIAHPYKWIGRSLFDLDRDELPEITDLKWHKELPSVESDDHRNYLNGGRNDKLKSMVTAAYVSGKSDIEISKEIYTYDKIHFIEKRLFTDADEGFIAENEDDALHNARRFTLSVMSSSSRKLRVEVRDYAKENLAIEPEAASLQKVEYPAPFQGLMFSFVDQAIKSVKVANLSAVLGGALSTLSILARHRIQYHGIQPNLLTMVIASSGEGKTEALNFTRDSLSLLNVTKSSIYKSGASFVETLQSMPMCLNIFDEAATFFGSMRSTNNFMSDLMDMINDTFTQTNRIASMPVTKERMNKSLTIEYPYLSFLCSTHDKGFKQNIGDMFAQSGMLARMTFIKTGEPGTVTDSEVPRREVMRFAESIRTYDNILNDVHPIKRMSSDSPMIVSSQPYAPHQLGIEPKAKALLTEYRHAMRTKAKSHENEAIKSFLNRCAEKVSKYMQLCYISLLDGPEITLDMVDWGIKMMSAETKAVLSDIEEMEAPDVWAKKRAQLKNYVLRKGTIKFSEANKAMRVDQLIFKKLVDTLVSTKDLAVVSRSGGVTLYVPKHHDAGMH